MLLKELLSPAGFGWIWRFGKDYVPFLFHASPLSFSFLSSFSFRTGSHVVQVADDGLHPQPPLSQCWGYRSAPLCYAA